MGRSIRYRYSVEMTTVQGYNTPAGWHTTGMPKGMNGKPNADKLARYCNDYNDSLRAGGVNAHIGDGGRCIAARIIDHDNNRDVVATWKPAAFRILPTFVPGERVTTSGFPGSIVRQYSAGMYEVRLASGVCCVPEGDIMKAGA